MFENDLSFSDSIEIIPATEEIKEEPKNNENMGPIIINEVAEVEDSKEVSEKREEIRNERRLDRRNEKNDRYDRNDRRENRQNRYEQTKPTLRQQSLYNTTSRIYVERYNEYNGIPDFIVNQIFEIDDGKGETTIEEAIIMLINLFPNTREKVNSAKYIEDAIKIGKSEIINSLYKECKYGYINIPMHSRDNLSKKITSDFENDNFDAALYDYQLMRLSGFLKNM